MNAPLIKKLALQQYLPTWTRMRQFTQQRSASSDDEIWLLEHFPVFTQGVSAKESDFLIANDIPKVRVDRGGKITYHAPGQIIMYLLLDVRRRAIGVRELVQMIEQTTIDILQKHGITASSNPTAPGVYVQGAKIASLGLRISRGCSYHGLALNADMNMQPFQYINPCGMNNIKMTQLKDHLPDVDKSLWQDELATTFCDYWQRW